LHGYFRQKDHWSPCPNGCEIEGEYAQTPMTLVTYWCFLNGLITDFEMDVGTQEASANYYLS
jgi:hypothetical protein